MTLTSLRNDILRFLTTSDTITPRDFGEIEIDKELEPQRDTLIRTVLGDLAQAGVLRELPASDPDQAIWILTAPLGIAGQDVRLSLPTCIHIAREISAFREAYEMEGEWPDPDALNVGEHNVLMLLAIIGELRSDPGFEGGQGGYNPSQDDGGGRN